MTGGYYLLPIDGSSRNDDIFNFRTLGHPEFEQVSLFYYCKTVCNDFLEVPAPKLHSIPWDVL